MIRPCKVSITRRSERERKLEKAAEAETRTEPARRVLVAGEAAPPEGISSLPSLPLLRSSHLILRPSSSTVMRTRNLDARSERVWAERPRYPIKRKKNKRERKSAPVEHRNVDEGNQLFVMPGSNSPATWPKSFHRLRVGRATRDESENFEGASHTNALPLDRELFLLHIYKSTEIIDFFLQFSAAHYFYLLLFFLCFFTTALLTCNCSLLRFHTLRDINILLYDSEICSEVHGGKF